MTARARHMIPGTGTWCQDDHCTHAYADPLLGRLMRLVGNAEAFGGQTADWDLTSPYRREKVDAEVERWQTEAVAILAEARSDAAALREALERCATGHHVRHVGHVPFNPDAPGFRGCEVESCKRNAAALGPAR